MADIIKPVVHRNGTSRESLAQQLEEALHALFEAREKLRAASPNGRDFYPLGPAAIQRAGEEHRSRDEKLAQVCAELEELYEHVMEGA